MHVSRQILLGLGVVSVLHLVGAPAHPDGALRAQSLTTGAVAGVVVDDVGDPIVGARVEVTERSSGITRVVDTDRDGRFRVPLLPAGDYDIRVEEIGLRPTRVLGVPVRLGRRVGIDVRLEPVVPPVDSVVVIPFDGAPALGALPGDRWFSGLEGAELPSQTRELAELARLSSTSDGGLGAEGLPGALSAVYVDGVPASGRSHPLLRSAPGGTPAYPLGAIDRATYSAGPLDVEWAGFAGATLAAFTRSGTTTRGASAFGMWWDEELTTSTYFDPGDAESSIHGGIRLGGSMLGDSARYLVGAEARRIDTPLWERWADGVGFESFRTTVADSLGVPVGFDGGRALARTESLAGFGRFDWWVAPDHRLVVRTNFATLPGGRAQPLVGSLDPMGPRREGEDATFAATLASTLPDGWANELRVGLARSSRTYGEGEPGLADEAPPTPTTIVGSGFEILGGANYGGRFDRRTLHVTEAVHQTFGIHRVKAGVTLEYETFDDVFALGRAGEFIFSDTRALLDGDGVFTKTVGAAPSAHFSVPRLAVFAQDRWDATDALEVTAGMRWDIQALPRSGITPNTTWRTLTDLANENIPDRIPRVSPRVGFTWDVERRRRWVVHGAVGIYHGRVDPALLAEVITRDGPLEVRRGVGDLGDDAWPGSPDEANTTLVGPTLTLMAPDFSPPRTARTTIGLTHSIDARTALHLSGVYRRTEFLPRRTDLNRVASAASVDPYGRPIYGELAQLGGVLAAEPATNRRFPDHDVVTAVNADGESSYWGATVRLERRAT
ncbi:MAG: TonB-dependent receptor domain-containing protein, partial [Gemmatimonadota bacterium]